MFAPSGRESFERTLHNSLAADVDPRAGSHLAVHGQAQTFEAIELAVIVPLANEIRVRDKNTRCFIVGLEFAHWFAGLDQKRLVVFELAQ